MKFLKVFLIVILVLAVAGGAFLFCSKKFGFFEDQSQGITDSESTVTSETDDSETSLSETTDIVSDIIDTTETEITDTVVSETESTAPVTDDASATTEPQTIAPVTTEPPVTNPPVTEAQTTKTQTTKTQTPEPQTTEPEIVVTQPETPDLSQEGAALEPTLKPAQITVLRPQASGISVKTSNDATVDYSNIADGYVMAKFTKDLGVRLKVQVTGPTTTYTYNVNPCEWTVFPLSDGNGSYTVKLFRNVVDNRYSTVLSVSFSVSLNNEFAPFLRPNQYVNYENEPLTCETASKVVSDGTPMIDKVKAVYNYVVANISYDYEKAATVKSGYLPDLDQILTSRRGICFDYAALMAGMLRSLDVPCKLVIGYAGTEYHAWISVWSAETGWIDGAIFFNGSSWQNMDPTFAATGSADSINSVTYTSKYVY